MPPKDAPTEQESSMRDDFDTAIAAVENDDEGAITVETAADAAEQITAEDLNADEAAEKAEAKATSEAEAATAAAATADSAGKAPADDGSGDKDGSADSLGAEPDEQATGNVNKAPESWSPAAREAWKDMPDAARSQVMKREGEINKALNEGAANRKTGEAFQGIADKYAQIFAAEGAPDPITGVEELVKTVTTLRMGSPQQKAQKVAGFIDHYGIDIRMLDDILSGNAATGGQPAPAGQLPPLDPRVESLLAQQEADRRAATFKKNQDAINEVATFKQNAEFYTDVQNDMADMVEMAEKRGVIMPLQEAYDKACALNPEVAGILEKRKADAALIGGQQTLAQKRAAAVSLNGKQGGGAVQGEELSMRQQIEAGFDAQIG